jgi:hypothetical protein
MTVVKNSAVKTNTHLRVVYQYNINLFLLYGTVFQYAKHAC